MIEFIVDGDIFKTKANILVNPVNCQGISGKGLAKAFKERFPLSFKKYNQHCVKGLMRPGDVLMFTDTLNDKPIWVAYFASKASWRNPSKLEWIETGLKQLADIMVANSFESIAIPAVGCGLGGLDWNNEVRPLFWKYFFDIEKISKREDKIKIEVYEPKEM